MKYLTRSTMPTDLEGVDVYAAYDVEDFAYAAPPSGLPEPVTIARFFGYSAQENATAYAQTQNDLVYLRRQDALKKRGGS